MCDRKIYTKAGDKGMTSIPSGEVHKTDTMIELLGTLDELNAHVGLALRHRNITSNKVPAKVLLDVQRYLFEIGAILATGKPSHWFSEWSVEELEDQIDYATEFYLEPLEHFILPGGSLFASQLHVCRAVTRRAERRFWDFHNERAAPEYIGQYLNRLSDWFFTMARVANTVEGVENKIEWKP